MPEIEIYYLDEQLIKQILGKKEEGFYKYKYKKKMILLNYLKQ